MLRSRREAIARIEILCDADDESRQLYVYNGRLDLDLYDLSEDEKARWIRKIEQHRVRVHLVREGSETIH